ncbi:MAG TPA: hypothetical protein VMU93_13995 [Caulobacteraceae bacterium]|nr:hypothetical protein [Caulobacteraceae bacterium]
MTVPNPPPGAADTDPGRVDRGQRIIDETELGDCHDGKERAHFARRRGGELPADMHGPGGAAPVTVEDVVEVAGAASAWEALEDDGGR